MSDSSKVPDFNPQIPEHLIEGLDAKDKYLFERVDIINQSLVWQGDKIANICDSMSAMDKDIEKLKEFRDLCETSSTISNAIKKEKKIQYKTAKKWGIPIVGVFLFLVYPLYLQAYSELGGSLIIRKIVETVLP